VRSSSTVVSREVYSKGSVFERECMRRSSREVLECSIERFLNSDLAVPYSGHLYGYVVRVTIVHWPLFISCWLPGFKTTLQ
jgi:hypothetical protein